MHFYRSSLFLKISQNFQENTCARASFLIKLQAPPVTLKDIPWNKCFLENVAKFLRTSFSQNISGRLLLLLVLCSSSMFKVVLVSLNKDSTYVITITKLVTTEKNQNSNDIAMFC